MYLGAEQSEVDLEHYKPTYGEMVVYIPIGKHGLPFRDFYLKTWRYEEGEREILGTVELTPGGILLATIIFPVDRYVQIQFFWDPELRSVVNYMTYKSSAEKLANDGGLMKVIFKKCIDVAVKNGFFQAADRLATKDDFPIL